MVAATVHSARNRGQQHCPAVRHPRQQPERRVHQNGKKSGEGQRSDRRRIPRQSAVPARKGEDSCAIQKVLKAPPRTRRRLQTTRQTHQHRHAKFHNKKEQIKGCFSR